MARGKLPAQTPQVPAESFIAFDYIYNYVQAFNKDVTVLERKATAAIVPAAFVANVGTAVNTASTFGGYTIGQIVAALRQTGTLT